MSENTDISALIEPDNRNNNKRCFGLSLEPSMLFLFFAVTLTGEVFANEIFYRTCTVKLEKNESACSRFLRPSSESGNTTDDLEALVQPLAAKIIMARSLIEAFVPAALSLILGPWSDRHGRKPLIIASFTGYTLMYLLNCALSALPDIDPWWYILSSIPVALSGGQCSLITGTFCYLTDVVPEKDRAVRMGLMEAVIFLGLLIGTLSAAPLYTALGSVVVFAIAALSNLLGLFYTCAFVRESVVRNPSLTQSPLRGLFDFTLAVDMIRVCCKARPRWDRAVIWMLMLIQGSTILVWEGNATVNYMFVREKFHWTITDYTRYNSASIVLTILGTGLGVYILSKFLGLSDLLLAILSQLSSTAESFIKALATQGWHMYLSAGVSLLRGVFGPMVRAFLSKIVSASDIGKVFSLVTSIESVTPLAASPIFTILYTNTLDVYPGAYNFLSGSIHIINTLVLISVYFLHRNMQNYMPADAIESS